MKRGVTLIELVVALTVFSVVVMVISGAFIAVSRSRKLTGDMRESQQKLRLAEEIMTRLSRQADYVKVSPDFYNLELYFYRAGSNSAEKFTIYPSSGDYKLARRTCAPGGFTYAVGTTPNCTSWPSGGEDLLGGKTVLNSGSYFEKKNNFIAPTLNIFLDGEIPSIISPAFESDFKILTTVILENIK